MCFEDGRVPHTDYVYLEAIFKSNMSIKFGRNWKTLSGSYKKLYDIKRLLLALKLYSGGL